MSSDYTPLIIDSGFLSDSKKIIRERIIPWEGLSRSGVISEDDANHIKILEKQSPENKKSTILSQLDLYTNTILNVLNKLEVNEKDDVLKNVLTLINDTLLNLPGQEFIDSLLKLSLVDSSLPYDPFLKHLESKDNIIKSLSLYNLVILLSKASKTDVASKVDREVIIKIFDVLSSSHFLSNKETNYQFIGIQLLLELLISKTYKAIFEKSSLVSHYKPINELITLLAKSPNSSGLQLSYNLLLTTWVLSFSGPINKALVHHFPDLIGSLLIIAKDSIKLKIVRISVGILKNFISVTTSESEQFKTIKLLLFHDGLAAINLLKERKFASNGGDAELSSDLAYLSDNLNEIVKTRLTSLDEYLTELENPNLISWSSPTHKSSDFWFENSGKFKDSSFKLVKKIFEVLSSDEYNSASTRVILLNDLQFLIKNIGQDLINFINTEKGGQYKLLIMQFLDDNNGDNELKYEALRTIQLLVGHSF
ncbi:putative vacuolar proton pump subunit [Suhomyces tanzawaensis NRRL Y-17324]|uniref:V-type proton ATPase subunit H n=1 Tax=Suhomyces tanzawaensis NRRL Y-17324 TaxID=984487 RepID=A0A1E4SKJ4_9ASCO|nr:putative vacuolar proton pump subunit [Suhomyces tanzawaensis NRRL Y-17324]ODV80029.1 putative vacuolar proton pump subunit [Suhomyces tanzawaensis NRRL Y-17324]